MRIWRTTDPLPASATDGYHIYNGLDCCVTREVYDEIEPKLNEVTRKIYNREKRLQGPVLEMNLRGVLVDTTARDDLIIELNRDVLFLEESLRDILRNGVGVDIDLNSPQKLAYLLYDVMGLPVQRDVKSRAPTVNRKALDKLKTYFYAAPIISHILAIRDLSKQISTLRTAIDGDNRIRTTFSIPGTDTGRFASYFSAEGTGTNLQNIDPRLRRVFIPDPGYKFAYVDLEQAESRGVGGIEWNLFHDGRYLDACESGDLHTFVARMGWPHLPWDGDLKHDKALAKATIFYREDDIRQGSKKMGHATNYYGKPPEIARQLGVQTELVANFQPKYFRAFPAHERWHEWVRQKILRDGFITTFMGRRRHFFGRRWDEDTVKAAIAYEPQSGVADYLAEGILALWPQDLCQILLQVHDALLVQFPEEAECEVVPQIKKALEITVPLLHGRDLVIPTEAETGWNWGKYDEKKNPNGIRPFTGEDKRKRVKGESILDRKFSEA